MSIKSTFFAHGSIALLLIVAITFVPLGLLEHQPFLTYAGLLAAVGSIIPVWLDTSVRTLLGFAGIGAVSLFALAQTGDYSWLAFTVASGAGLWGLYMVRRNHQRLPS
jgi:hypothetical protein